MQINRIERRALINTCGGMFAKLIRQVRVDDRQQKLIKWSRCNLQFGPKIYITKLNDVRQVNKLKRNVWQASTRENASIKMCDWQKKQQQPA